MFYNVSYKNNGVTQAILVKADTQEQATELFQKNKPSAEIYGVELKTNINEDLRKGKPIMKNDFSAGELFREVKAEREAEQQSQPTPPQNKNIPIDF